MNCVRVGNAIVCGRFPTRLICDVDDRPVKRTAPKFNWRGREIDLCPVCRTRYEADEPGFRAFADKAIAKNLNLEEVKVCDIRKEHKKRCRYRRAAELSVELACDHGAQACPTCDPCTCGSKSPLLVVL